jgi:hypothetical protein
MEEKKEIKTNKYMRVLAIFAIFAGLTFAGLATYQVVMDVFFSTIDPGIVVSGYLAPASMITGNVYSLNGQFANNANQAHTITPEVTFVSDTAFGATSEFGSVSLGADVGTCVLSTTLVTDDTLTCTFSAQTIPASSTTTTLPLSFETPLMWDGTTLGIQMLYS